MSVASALAGITLARKPPFTIVGETVLRSMALSMKSPASARPALSAMAGSSRRSIAVRISRGSPGAIARKNARVVGVSATGNGGSATRSIARARRTTQLSGRGIDAWPATPVAVSV